MRIIVPFAPGGSTDIVARAIAAKAGESTGQSFVVDNRAGAGGTIGAEAAAKAAADGHTLFMGHVGTLAINPSLPYKGTGPATTAILTGEVSVMFTGQGTAWPLIRAGRLKPIAMTSSRRASHAPNVATVAEGLPGYEVINWHGVLAPAGTPPEVVGRAHAEIVKALGSPDVRSKLTSDGFEVVGNAPDAFARFIRSEMAKWAKIIENAGITAQ